MKIREQRHDHVIVGSGAAGYRAALALNALQETDVLLVTENRLYGTSRNTGSDKQTYYKLSLSGSAPDSVQAMAEDLFAGQCVDGDIALCEAALSARGFYHLVEIGVPFPSNAYGAYMGYQTDHDTRSRATSAGPYTSKLMTECLERAAEEKQIPVLDHCQAIRLLVKDKRIYGVLCLDLSAQEEPLYHLIWCKNLILATGGPAGIYSESVYPVSQLGSSGIAFEAGVKGKNLTEWQFGMASVAPRWNVSGTYMQVLPTFISTDADGGDEREFLLEHYSSREEMLSQIFLKGYQWPFDTAKIYGGSSVIDLLVYREIFLRGRRVFLDFRKNTGDADIPFERLAPEAYQYLEKAGALTGRPIDRLRIMNEPAISFYRDHDVDLETEMLEISVCAQHNNGGLSADAWWETDVSGLFAIGEVCGSHGVTRPGGSALNAGQAGAVRAAERIRIKSVLERESCLQADAEHSCPTARADAESGCRIAQEDPASRAMTDLRIEAEAFASLPEQSSGTTDAKELWDRAAKRMSACGGMVRNTEEMSAYLEELLHWIRGFSAVVRRPSAEDYPAYFRLRDMLLSQAVYLTAMISYVSEGGGSRGSGLYTDPDGHMPGSDLPGLFRARLDDRAHADVIQEAVWDGEQAVCSFRPVRPLPRTEDFFENEWKAYRRRMGLGG